MKKFFSLVLLTITASILVGCGGGSSSSETTTDTVVVDPIPTPTNQVVLANGTVLTLDSNNYLNGYTPGNAFNGAESFALINFNLVGASDDVMSSSNFVKVTLYDGNDNILGSYTQSINHWAKQFLLPSFDDCNSCGYKQRFKIQIYKCVESGGQYVISDNTPIYDSGIRDRFSDQDFYTFDLSSVSDRAGSNPTTPITDPGTNPGTTSSSSDKLNFFFTDYGDGASQDLSYYYDEGTEFILEFTQNTCSDLSFSYNGSFYKPVTKGDKYNFIIQGNKILSLDYRGNNLSNPCEVEVSLSTD